MVGHATAVDMEVSGHLVGSAAFKAVGTGDPRPAGSIPVHLRHGRSVGNSAGHQMNVRNRWTRGFAWRRVPVEISVGRTEWGVGRAHEEHPGKRTCVRGAT